VISTDEQRALAAGEGGTARTHPIFKQLAAKTKAYAILDARDLDTASITVSSEQGDEATGEIPTRDLEATRAGLDASAHGGAEVAQVVVEQGIGVGRAFDVDGFTRLGRSRSCDIRLDDPAIGAYHLIFSWSRGAWKVRDLGSSNGTLLDGRAIAGTVEISSGDRLRVGSSTLRFEAGELSQTIDNEKAPHFARALPLAPPSSEKTVSVALPPYLRMQSFSQAPAQPMPRRLAVPPAFQPRKSLDSIANPMHPDDVRRAVRLVVWSLLVALGLVAAAVLVRVLR